MKKLRNRVLFLFILSLVFINLLILWYYTHINGDGMDISHSVQYLDVTIIINHFEHFENNIIETVHHITKLYPHVHILILSPSFPYPYFNIDYKNVKLVRTNLDFTRPKHFTDPLYYVNTQNVLILPDAVRFYKNISLSDILLKYDVTRNDVMVFHILSKIKDCARIDLDLKLWTLKYFSQDDLFKCDAFPTAVGILVKTKMLRNFVRPFIEPFQKSFFIQCKFSNCSLHVSHEKILFYGKFLFSTNHNKWKRDQSIEHSKKRFYQLLGVKYELNLNGVEEYYGCNKQTPRCFPTVHDVPYYLYEGKWTPPCCLKALRETAKHVFSTCNRYQIRYWLEGGSLLGAARYGDIIPWDYDVDIGIYMDDIKNFKFLSEVWKARVKHVDKEGFVWERATEGDFIRVQYSETNHLHVDMFPFYEKNGVMTKNTWFKTHRQDTEFPVHYLNPMQEILFAGVVASAPNDIKQFLELKFGKGVIENPQYPFPEKLGA